MRKHSYLNSFVKVEKEQLKPDKPDPCPRLIQPRHPVYNFALGRHIAHLEKPIYRWIAKIWGGPTVMKGYNAEETAFHLRQMWEEFNDPVAIPMDFSRFDQHVNDEVLGWEHDRYLECVPSSQHKELAKLLSWQVENRGFIRCPDGEIKYRTQGCRMSGDMNTAMGNCLISAAIMYSFSQLHGLKCRLANNGDDCVIICERNDAWRLRALPEFTRRLGFTLEVEPSVDVFEQISFCQTQPVFDGERWIMCRDPRVCISKDAVSTLPLDHPNIAQAWFGAVGQCGLSLAGRIPILQEVYLAYIRASEGKMVKNAMQMESGFFHLARGMTRKAGQVSSAARVSFWNAFGITPTEQMQVELELRSLNIPVLVSQGITLPAIPFVNPRLLRI